MARLDAEAEEAEFEARSVDAVDEGVAPAAVRQYLANLARLWRETTVERRRAMAEATFERVDALGLGLVVYPSIEAERCGLADAFGPDSIACTISQSGRGGRNGPSATQQIRGCRVTMGGDQVQADLLLTA
jgi:hypothetical protein